MFDSLKLWSLRRKLRGSLAADPFQIGWDAWLKGSTSIVQLHQTCSNPGWLLHCAYWNGEEMNRLLEAALEMAQLAIEHGPPNVMKRETVLDLRQIPLPEVAELIVEIEARYPAIIDIERALPGVSSIQMRVLDEARAVAKAKRKLARAEAVGKKNKKRRDEGPDESDDGVDLLISADEDGHEFDGEQLVKAGKAGAAAAGFSLALQTLFHRNFGMKDPLVLSAAGAGALFSVALPDNRADLMAVVRERFGWSSPPPK
jgi:hypothetical protein